MAAPTAVAEYESTWNAGTTPRTASVTVAAGDTLVVYAVSETNVTFSTPTGGGLTYTLRQSIQVSSYCAVSVWTAPSASSQTFTLSVGTDSGASWFGFNALRFSGSSGIGASTKTNVASGGPSLAITTTGANSAIVVVNGDWNATDGTSRTWRTGAGALTERTYFRDASHYTVYGGFHADAGTTGAKTVGLSAPTGQKYSIIAVEVLGTSGGQSAALGQASETDTATSTARAKTRAAGQPSTTDTATAAARSKSRATGQPSVTSTAQPLTKAKARTTGQATGTDTATALTRSKTRTLGLATTADTATAAGRTKARTLGQATETDTGLAAGRGKTRAVGQPSETDTGASTGRRKTRLLGVAVETDTAGQITDGGGTPIGQASESSTAGVLARAKARTLGLAVETDTGTAVARRKARQVAQAVSTSTGLAVGRMRSRVLGMASESSVTGGEIDPTKAGTVGPATETSTAYPLVGAGTPSVPVTVTSATVHYLATATTATVTGGVSVTSATVHELVAIL